MRTLKDLALALAPWSAPVVCDGVHYEHTRMSPCDLAIVLSIKPEISRVVLSRGALPAGRINVRPLDEATP